MNRMKASVVVLASVLTVVFSQATEVSQCQGSYAVDLPIHTYVEGCQLPPCGLPKAQDAVINIVYRAPRRMVAQAYTARAFLGILPIPYPLGQRADACLALTNSYCPVLEGEVLTSTFKMYMEDTFPEGTQLPLELSLADETGELVYCLRVTIRVDPPTVTVPAGV